MTARSVSGRDVLGQDLLLAPPGRDGRPASQPAPAAATAPAAAAAPGTRGGSSAASCVDRESCAVVVIGFRRSLAVGLAMNLEPHQQLDPHRDLLEFRRLQPLARRLVVVCHPVGLRVAGDDDFADRDDRPQLDLAQPRQPLGPRPRVGDRLLVGFLLELVEVVEDEADQARRWGSCRSDSSNRD